MDRSSAPVPGPIRPFEFPAVSRTRLGNGLSVLSARSGELPLVTVRAVLDAGAATEQPGEEGLAWLTAHALEGGTERRSGEDLGWAVESLGAQLETWTSWDGLHVAFTTRNDRLAEALDLLAEIVRLPSFPQREVERLRSEQLAEMLRRQTEPRGLADDAAAHFIFDDGAPYARSLLGIEAQVGTFTRDDTRAFHQRRFTPGNAAIVVVGAVDPADVEREVGRAFGDWSGRHEPASVPPVSPRSDRTKVYVVDRPSAVQSELRIGHVGVPRDHEDYYPLMVFNAIVGGAFTSRLNLSLREKHGFTYGVRSGFAFRRGAGPFIIQTAVASDVTARAVAETLSVLRTVQQDGVSDAEVAAARDYLAGTLPLSMQTTEQLSARVAELHTFELPTDYFDSHRAGIGAVTRDDVIRVARSHLRLEQLAVVVVGSADAVTADLQSLDIGDVVRHDDRLHEATVTS
jgi:zinc protease